MHCRHITALEEMEGLQIAWEGKISLLYLPLQYTLDFSGCNCQEQVTQENAMAKKLIHCVERTLK